MGILVFEKARAVEKLLADSQFFRKFVGFA
jgi:hypothetical protein